VSAEHTLDPYRAVRDYVDNDGSLQWKHKEIAKDLYSMGDVMRNYFFSPKNTDDYEMPPTLVGVEDMRHDTLAAYYLVENPLGLRYQISMNSLWIDRPKWELYETLLHEIIHLFQENNPELTKCTNGYHNRTFVEIAEEVGLHPRLGVGSHTSPADGQFERLMGRYDIAKPEYAKALPPIETNGNAYKFWWDDNRGRRKGASTLLKWVCDCQPPQNSVRTGRKDLMAMCLGCGQVFKPEALG
jgi:hypothetical protein